MFYFLLILVWLPITLLFPTKIIGKKNMPKKQGVVVVCNHLSNLDAILLNVKYFYPFNFLAKAELFKNKFMAWILKKLHAIPIKRAEADIKAIKAGLSVLKDNKPLMIFPEGTRNKGDEETLGQIHDGATMFATRANVMIVPVCIYKKPKLFRPNIIKVGEPFKLEVKDNKHLSEEEMTQATQLIAQKMADLRAELDIKYKKKK